MSATPSPETPAAAKKSRKMPLLIGLVVLLVVGGGGGGFFFFKGAGAATKETAEKGKKSKAKAAHNEDEEGEAKGEGHDEEEEEAAEEEHAEETGHKSKKSEGGASQDDSKVKQVIELQPFIVNLADKGESRYLRLTVNVGIGGEEEGKEESKADPLFTTRVRNAMLAVLTSKTSDDILTTEGKNALRKELLRAARKVSEEPEVHAIYITDFIVQM